MKTFINFFFAAVILSSLASAQGPVANVPSKEPIKLDNPVKPDTKPTTLGPVSPDSTSATSALVKASSPEPKLEPSLSKDPIKVESTPETPKSRALKPEPSKQELPKVDISISTPTKSELSKVEQPKITEPAKSAQSNPQNTLQPNQTIPPIVNKGNSPVKTSIVTNPDGSKSTSTYISDANFAETNKSTDSGSSGGTNVGGIVGGVIAGFVIISALGAFVYRKIARRSWREYTDEEYITTTSQEHINTTSTYAHPSSYSPTHSHQGSDPFKNTLDQYHRGHRL